MLVDMVGLGGGAGRDGTWPSVGGAVGWEEEGEGGDGCWGLRDMVYKGVGFQGMVGRCACGEAWCAAKSLGQLANGVIPMYLRDSNGGTLRLCQ